MESLQFVGCSWFIGLIGLGFRFTQNKSTSTELCAISRPSPVSSSTHLDAPGVAIATKLMRLRVAWSDNVTPAKGTTCFRSFSIGNDLFTTMFTAQMGRGYSGVPYVVS